MARKQKYTFKAAKKSYQKSIADHRKNFGFHQTRGVSRSRTYGSQNHKSSNSRRKYNTYPKTSRKSSSQSYTNSSPKQGCYIATCVYGSYDCPEVWTLRRYRDFYLDKSWYGRLFIKCYYAVSPTLVKMFGDFSGVRFAWKKVLDCWVKSLNNKGYESSKYSDKY